MKHLLATFVAMTSLGALPLAAADKPNVLFIAIDDLNDWVGCLGGNPQAKTPNIDRLAARGVNFTRAYTACPLCNPSRTAVLSGLRASSTGVYTNESDWRETRAGQVATLNMHFKRNGYYTAGAGKIYHGVLARFDDGDWDVYLRHRDDPKEKLSRKRSGGREVAPTRGLSKRIAGIDFAPLDVDDAAMPDFQSVEFCIDQLQRTREQPLFLACGINKPHVPWYVPRKYYDMFPLESIELPVVLEDDLDDVPATGVQLANPRGNYAKMLASGKSKDAVQAYLATSAFADAMVGRLLDALDRSPRRDNTIVVLWSDHGWHLGEKLHWHKSTLWEEATRAPLMFVTPGVTTPGSVCDRTVDFTSIYPTLCELCGLNIPEHVEGVSVKGLLAKPQASWERPAMTTHGYMNHAVRSERWRYIRYADGGEELYDELADPNEWTNVAERPEFASVKQDLARWMPKKNVAAMAGGKTNLSSEKE